MDRKRKQTGSRRLQWIIRLLVIVIFAVALVITANRIVEWQQRERYERELEEKRQELTESEPQ